MPLSLRFVVPLALALAAIAYAVVPLVDKLTFQWFVRDLDARGALIAQTAQEPLSELLRDPKGARARVLRYFQRIMHGERIFAIGFCSRAGKLEYASPGFPAAVRCEANTTEQRSRVLRLADGPLHVSENPIAGESGLNDCYTCHTGTWCGSRCHAATSTNPFGRLPLPDAGVRPA